MATPPRIVPCSSGLAAICGATTGGVLRELEEEFAGGGSAQEALAVHTRRHTCD